MSNTVHACSTEHHETLSEKFNIHIINTNISSKADLAKKKHVTSECI